MPFNIEQITNQVSVVDSEMPFSEAQLERLVELVVKRLQERRRDNRWRREATTLRHEAMPETPDDGGDF
jgi:hypothetical protein